MAECLISRRDPTLVALALPFGEDREGNHITGIFTDDFQHLSRYRDENLQLASARPDYSERFASVPPREPEIKNQREGFSSDSGFSIASGFIVTNHHVVDGWKDVDVISVVSKDRFAAEVVATDATNDLAILRVNVPSKALPVKSSRSARKGDQIFTVGFPSPSLMGVEAKASFGRINALSGPSNDTRYIQIDIPVQPGNSGGALVDQQAQVIGVVSAKLNTATAIETAGFIPDNVSYAVRSDALLNLAHSVGINLDTVNNVVKGAGTDLADLVKIVEDSSYLIIVER